MGSGFKVERGHNLCLISFLGKLPKALAIKNALKRAKNLTQRPNNNRISWAQLL